MGVKFNREYPDIVNDMVHAISTIADCYTAFEMGEDDWQSLQPDEQQECIRTLADDIFYGLGRDRQLHVGSGKIEYDPDKHILRITSTPQVVHIVQLL